MARESKKELQRKYEQYRIAAMNYQFKGLHAERFSIRGIPELNPSWTMNQLRREIEKIKPERITTQVANPSPYIIYQEEVTFRGRGGKQVTRKTEPITVSQLRYLQNLISQVNKVRRKEKLEPIGKPVMYKGQEVITQPFTGNAPFDKVVEAIKEKGNKEKIDKKKKQMVDNFRMSLTVSLKFTQYVDFDDEDEFVSYYLVNVLREYVSRTNWRYIYDELYKARNSGINFSEIFGSDQVVLGSVDNIEQLYSIFTKYNAPNYDIVKNDLSELYRLNQKDSRTKQEEERRKYLANRYTVYTKRANEAIATSHYLMRMGKVR